MMRAVMLPDGRLSKTCSVCGQTFAGNAADIHEKFSAHAKAFDGCDPRCKVCVAARRRTLAASDRTYKFRNAAAQQRWRDRQKEKTPC